MGVKEKIKGVLSLRKPDFPVLCGKSIAEIRAQHRDRELFDSQLALLYDESRIRSSAREKSREHALALEQYNRGEITDRAIDLKQKAAESAGVTEGMLDQALADLTNEAASKEVKAERRRLSQEAMGRMQRGGTLRSSIGELDRQRDHVKSILDHPHLSAAERQKHELRLAEVAEDIEHANQQLKAMAEEHEAGRAINAKRREQILAALLKLPRQKGSKPVATPQLAPADAPEDAAPIRDVSEDDQDFEEESDDGDFDDDDNE